MFGVLKKKAIPPHPLKLIVKMKQGTLLSALVVLT